MAPAIRLAREGFVLVAAMRTFTPNPPWRLRAQANVAAIFLEHGAALQPGQRLVQPELAATLRKISDAGTDAFYRGDIAAAVAAREPRARRRAHAADFADYSVTESAPLSCTYRGYTILSAPPPSSGGVVLCEMLRVLEAYPLRTLGFHSSGSVHLMTEAMRHAFSTATRARRSRVRRQSGRAAAVGRARQAIRAAIRPHRPRRRAARQRGGRR